MVERAPSREVLVRPRALLVVAASALAVWVLLEAWQVVTWIVIAVVLSIALMPAVDLLERRGPPNGAAVAAVCVAALAVVGLLARALLPPPLVRQTTELVRAVPDALDDVTRGRGPLGFLQTEYGLADRARGYLDASRPAAGRSLARWAPVDGFAPPPGGQGRASAPSKEPT